MGGPTSAKRLLGTALHDLRTRHEQSRDEIARVLKCGPTKVTNQESGRNPIGPLELSVLAAHYGLSESQLADLERLRAQATQRGWWSKLRLPESLALYVALETEARRVRDKVSILIPGLLQTEGYIRFLHEHRVHRHSADDLERRITARLRRQQRLTDGSLELCAIIPEEAFQRCLRQPEIATEQLERLIEWAQLPNVEVQVLPLDGGLHAGMEDAFTLLSFPEDLLPDAGWQESVLGARVVDDQEDVATLSTLYDELRGQALARDESSTWLAEFIQNTRRQ